MSKFVKIGGLDELRRDLRKLPDRATKNVKRAIEDAAARTASDARAFAPFDARQSARSRFFLRKRKGRLVFARVPTPHLRDTINYKLGRDGLTARIGSTQRIIGKRLHKLTGWRAHFTIFGTRGGVITKGFLKGTRIPPRPANDYLGKALAKNEERYVKNVGQAVNEALSHFNFF